MTFQELIEDIEGRLIEGVFNSRWELISCYHSVGKTIVDYIEETGAGTDSEVCHAVAQASGKSQRTIYNAIQFYRKYPNLDKLPEGKNISWHKICNNYLPEHKEAEEKEAAAKSRILTIVKDFLYSYCLSKKIAPSDLELEDLLYQYEKYRRTKT